MNHLRRLHSPALMVFFPKKLSQTTIIIPDSTLVTFHILVDIYTHPSFQNCFVDSVFGFTVPLNKQIFLWSVFYFEDFAFNFSVFFSKFFTIIFWLIYTVGQKRFSVTMVCQKILDLLWNLRLLIVSWMCEWNDCLDVERER